MDNTDCTASYSRVFTNRAEADETLAALSKRARDVESEPCEIKSSFTKLKVVCVWILTLSSPVKRKH
jgi:uncharacterized protein (TIGR00743 family)